MAAAQDTAGEAAAGKFYDAAKATFATLVDRKHTVSSLYGMVNVPTGVWIDEQGRIVRPLETAYTSRQTLNIPGGKSITTEGDRYVEALRDWVANGASSKYVLSGEQIRAALRGPTDDEKQADSSFRLAVFLHDRGRGDLAAKWFQNAQKLNPESWNYHRQEWSFTPAEAGGKWLKKFQSQDKPYYDPLKLPPK